MVNYKCFRCGKEFKQKGHLLSHLTRKYPCQTILQDVDNITIMKLNKIYEGTEMDNYIKSDEIKKIDNKYKCPNCNKLFLKKEELDKHLKISCKMGISFNNIYKFDKKQFGKNIYKSKDSGDIYIIQTDYINKDCYKIGITSDIERRLKDYRCGNTYEPRLHYFFPCKNIRIFDKILKEGLLKYNLKREIYKGKLYEIKSCIINLLKNEFKNEVLVKIPEIKECNLCECMSCNRCFLTADNLFNHLKDCKKYKEDKEQIKYNKLCCKFCGKQYKYKQGKWKHEQTCQHPENHNIRIKDMKNGMAEIREKDRWNYISMNDFLDEMRLSLYDKLETLKDNICEEELDLYDEHLDRVNEILEDMKKIKVINSKIKIASINGTNRIFKKEDL